MVALQGRTLVGRDLSTLGAHGVVSGVIRRACDPDQGPHAGARPAPWHWGKVPHVCMVANEARGAMA